LFDQNPSGVSNGKRLGSLREPSVMIWRYVLMSEDCKLKLEGYKGVFRLRVGDVRVYFIVEGAQVIAEDLDKRGDSYRKKTRNKLRKR
jgi:hypothetical protein